MTGTLNLNFILYTAFRLAPFIIVSFFSLSSVLNQDLKGVIYLAGLLFACFFAVIISTVGNFSDVALSPENQAVCNAITLSDTGRLSKIPLGMVVFSYTFFYLVDTIAKYGLVSQNIPTFIIFPAIIMCEGIWNMKYQCATLLQLILAFAIGSLGGFLWSRIIRSTGAIQLQYFNGINNSQTCSRPSKQKFKCTFNGGIRKNTISSTNTANAK
jgi:hypothetical protein